MLALVLRAALALALLASAVHSTGCRCSRGERDSNEPVPGAGTREQGQGRADEPATAPQTFPGGWVRRFGGAGDDGGTDLAADGADVVLTSSSAGVARYGSDGAVGWAHQLGASSDDRGEAVAVLPSGFTVTAGTVAGTVRLARDVTARGGSDPNGWTGYVAGYGPDGEVRWAHTLDATQPWPRAVAPLAGGRLAVAGVFDARLTLGGLEANSAGQTDGFVALMSAEGEPVWLVTTGGTGDDSLWDVAADAEGNLYVTGAFHGTLRAGEHSVEADGEARDLYVASLDAHGKARWLRRFGGKAWDAGYGIAVDASGVYVTGVMKRPGTYHGGRPTFYDDIYVASLTLAGEERWSHRFGARVGWGNDLAVVGGRVCVTGSFSGNVSFGGEDLWGEVAPEVALIPGGGEPETDGFVACFTTAGEHRSSRRFGGQTADSGAALAFDGQGRLYVTGSFTGTAAFEGKKLTSAGGEDGFLLRLDGPGAER